MTSEAGPCPVRLPHKSSGRGDEGRVCHLECSLWHDACGVIHAPGREGAAEFLQACALLRVHSLSLVECKVLYLESGFIVLFFFQEQAVPSRAGVKPCFLDWEATSCCSIAGTHVAPGIYPEGLSTKMELSSLGAPLAWLTSDLTVGWMSRVGQRFPVCP